MAPNFETEVYGKWILSGEHAVLRGAKALVFPVFQRGFGLRFFESSAQDLDVELDGAYGDEMRLLFHGVLEKALANLGKSLSHVQGRFEIRNDIPVGAGMGASAALCVGVARWMTWKGWIDDNRLYTFATELENLFHGESSGVDIAVALAGHGLLYQRGGVFVPIEPKWHPHWYLSYCGQKGLTSVCVEKVRRLGAKDPELARKLDAQMARATEIAHEALLSDEKAGFSRLVEAIKLGHDCFKEWGLIESDLAEHIDQLRALGAVAVKPTGSGMGGFVLSLWRESLGEQEGMISLNLRS